MAAGGSYYYADLVVDALRQSGYELRARPLRPRLRMLVRPRGPGSGRGRSGDRLVRLRSERRRDRVGAANLPGVSFAVSPERPPLPYPDHRFEFAFAISIWSHFAEDAALDWLAEMRRIVKPGGRLVITTHGEQAITHSHARRAAAPRASSRRCATRCSRTATGTPPSSATAGDHGVANQGWGTSFLTAEWLLARATPEWHVAFFRPGRVEGNQDLFVLEPR